MSIRNISEQEFTTESTGNHGGHTEEASKTKGLRDLIPHAQRSVMTVTTTPHYQRDNQFSKPGISGVVRPPGKEGS